MTAIIWKNKQRKGGNNDLEYKLSEKIRGKKLIKNSDCVIQEFSEYMRGASTDGRSRCSQKEKTTPKKNEE